MTLMANDQDQKSVIAHVFERAAAGYEHITHFPPLGRRLVALAQIPARASVLDVACGRGAVLFPAAERAGPLGEVVGVDISPGMVRATAAEVARRGLGNVRVSQMDAEALDFPDESFDFVLCGFALQFFRDLARGLAEFRRVLRPGGRVVVSTWGADDERWAWYPALRAAYGASVRLQSQSFEQPETAVAYLEQAGFAEIQVRLEPFDWVCAEAEEWWAAQWSMSSRAGLERLGLETLEQLKAEVFRKMAALRQADGFHELLRPQFTVGQKGEASL